MCVYVVENTTKSTALIRKEGVFKLTNIYQKIEIISHRYHISFLRTLAVMGADL